MNGFYFVDLFSMSSDRKLAVDASTMRELAGLAEDYGWKPQFFDSRSYPCAAAALTDPFPDEPIVVPAQDALAFAAALESSRTGIRLAAAGGPVNPLGREKHDWLDWEPWEELVCEMAALAAAGAFRAVVLRTSSKGR